VTSPKNTSITPQLGWLFGGNPRAIEEQEAEGAAQMLNATTLPTRLNYSKQHEFEELGFTFGKQVPGDELFREATLPEGWTKEGTGHSMWTRIKDERGIERVSIFYKAAFYDRDAFMSLTNVGYKIANDYIYGDEDNVDTELLAKLTESEKQDAINQCEDYLERAERSPDIYGDKKSRAEKLLEAL
jgi:hypothetical protein